MLCDRCDKEIKPAAINPTLELKALGLYPTDHMTIGMVSTAFAAIVGSAAGEIATAPIVVAQRFAPRQLHRQPGLPFNAYPLINGVCWRVSSATAAPTLFVYILKYRDVADIETVVASGVLGATQEQTGISPLLPLVSSSVLGELPSTFGSWVLEGTLTIGPSTGITVTVYANFGILYGAPK